MGENLARGFWRRRQDSNLRELLKAQGFSKPPQWANYATPPYFESSLLRVGRLYHRAPSICYTLAVGLLDLLFPRRCASCRKQGSYLCTNCFALLSFDTRLPCFRCNRPSFDGLTHPGCRGRYTLDGMFAAMVYTRVVKKLIAAYKYKPYVSDLTNILGALFIEGILEEESLLSRMQSKTVFVPIPLHKVKLRMRGYNHAGLLADELSKYFHLPKKNLLLRAKPTRSQFGLAREARLENLKDAFQLRPESQTETVILVDDIVTTGTTFREAAKVLKMAGAREVYGIALAHGN